MNCLFEGHRLLGEALMSVARSARVSDKARGAQVPPAQRMTSTPGRCSLAVTSTQTVAHPMTRWVWSIRRRKRYPTRRCLCSLDSTQKLMKPPTARSTSSMSSSASPTCVVKR